MYNNFNTKKMKKSFFLSNDSKKKEQVLKMLNRAQTLLIPPSDPSLGVKNPDRLICEDGDWLPILQWLQDQGLGQTNPVRPPFKAFEQWLRENNVLQFRAHYSAYEMSLAHRRIKGARYPWNEVQHNRSMIRRWRILYQDLSRQMAK